MSQEAAARLFQRNFSTDLLSQPKPTFAVLSEAIVDAANSVSTEPSRDGGPLMGEAFDKLRDQLFLSPRLSQWQLGTDEKGNKGYWLRTKDQSATVTVRENKVVLSTPDRDHPKYPFNYDIISDNLASATLFKSIQDAQAIVQPQALNGMATDDDGEEFFAEEPEYVEGAGLDAALEETHAEPLIEDDAELIGEVTAEEALNEDQRREDGPEPVVKVSQQFIEDISQPKTDSFTASANRKNASTDGVICSYCGNLNRGAYKGTCPKCPKKNSFEQPVPSERPDRDVPPQPSRDSASEAWLMARLKSLQGRVLTILDASPIADKAQRDAVKTLLNKEFRREMNRVSDGGWRAKDPRYEE
jgi:hypothetical protein